MYTVGRAELAEEGLRMDVDAAFPAEVTAILKASVGESRSCRSLRCWTQ